MTLPDRPRRGDALLLAGLASGMQTKAAARHAGLSERTAHRRLNEPAFRRQLEQANAAALAEARTRLTAAASPAAATLAVLMAPTEQPWVRLTAARTVLEMAIKLTELVALEERVAALEQQQAPAPSPMRRWRA